MRGRIQRALSGFYYVKCADGQLYTCKARGKFRREGISPLVGDDVEFCEVPGGEGRIDEILATGLHAYLTQFLDRVNDLGGGISRDFLVTSGD